MTIHILAIHGPLKSCSDSNAIKRNREKTTDRLAEELRPLRWPLKQKHIIAEAA